MTKGDKETLIQSEAAAAFFKRHKQDDPLKLLLKYAQKPHERWLSIQLALRKKLAKKLPQWSAHPTLIFPEGLPTEQCTSEAVARLKANLLSGEKLLDITAGMGIDAYYLSQSFKNLDLFEQDETLADITEYNLTQLSVKHQLHKTSFHPEKLKGQYDLIYADPARRDAHKNQVVSLQDYTPNLLEYLPDLLKHGKAVLIKASPMLDIELAIKQLKLVREVWVISYRNECKEVLFYCSASADENALQYKLFNIDKAQLEELSFSREEKNQQAPLSSGLKKYLYAPNASIMKAHATDVLAHKLQLLKAHPNTNLLLSNEYLPSFPGKCFEIQSLHSPKDKSLKKKKRNVISRNFFEKADQIAQRLRLTPAKTEYLIAFTFLNEDKKEQATFALAKQIIA